MKTIHGFDIYRRYLAMKQHFTNVNFDFFQYEGKVNAKEETYQQRSDFYFFETLARKLNAREVDEYLLSSFVYSNDPNKVWVGEVKKRGKDLFLLFHKRWESMSYLFQQDLEYLKTRGNFNVLLTPQRGHPELLRQHIKGNVMLETLLILDVVCKYQKDWDEKLRDPIWERLSFLIRKYKPFCSVDRQKYKEVILKTFQGV